MRFGKSIGVFCWLIILTLVFFCCRSSGQVKPNRALKYFNEIQFNTLFPQHLAAFNYNSFKKAVLGMANISVIIERKDHWIYKITRLDKQSGKKTVVRQDKEWEEDWVKNKPYSKVEIDYADFCASDNEKNIKRELAAFFANIAHETRNGADKQWKDGLMLVKELDTNSSYITPNLVYPASAGKKYYGRGPLQLSYNGNYGFASDCIFGDKNTLLKNPELVADDAVIAFETAIYFWMTPQSDKPSAHEAFLGLTKADKNDQSTNYPSGFGTTIFVINGAIECGLGDKEPHMLNRIGYYRHFLSFFKLEENEANCSCGSMVQN